MNQAQLVSLYTASKTVSYLCFTLYNMKSFCLISVLSSDLKLNSIMFLKVRKHNYFTLGFLKKWGELFFVVNCKLLQLSDTIVSNTCLFPIEIGNFFFRTGQAK